MEMGNFRLKLKSQDFFNNIKMNTSWQDQERKHINIFYIIYLYLCKVFCTKLHTTQYFFNIQATVLTYVYRYARRIYHILRIKKKMYSYTVQRECTKKYRRYFLRILYERQILLSQLLYSFWRVWSYEQELSSESKLKKISYISMH